MKNLRKIGTCCALAGWFCFIQITGKSLVSDILSGKRSLNIGHIKRLAERFKVSPSLFVN
ncbi:MAG: hypothetical protein IPK04_20330 [Bdellovibrionales bacterium]|nr:hypothetical protein [Bdellovibrionales bacterium]